MKQNTNSVQTYLIQEIPNPEDSRYQAAAQGNVRNAIFSGCEGLLHKISHLLPQTVTAELLFVFAPECEGRDRQSRLKLYLRIWASNDEMLKCMALLIERGELSRFYRFEPVNEPLKLLNSAVALCDVVRRQDFVEPLFGCEQNINIPGTYYAIYPLVPNDKNDMLTVDRILDQVTESIVLSIRIQPANPSVERHAMTCFIERLHSVNHVKNWRHGDFSSLNFMEGNTPSFLNRYQEPDLPHRNDPSAEDIKRSLRDIHESLYRKTHLLFSIRVLAETCAAAQLVAAVFAGSAFKEGDYRLVTSKKGEPLFDQTVETDHSVTIQPFQTYKYIWPEPEGQQYNGLQRLVQLAPVEELIGAFRLPVASPFSPLCICKNTDAPYEPSEDVIVLGFDEQGVEGNRNPKLIGMPPQFLKTHMATFGRSGSGKTTANINGLYQLHEMMIPFLVIETAKTEYRVIKKSKEHKTKRYRKLAERLEVYTAAEEQCSPCRFNPLERLDGISPDAHVDNLMECFDATMAMPPYVRSILREALLDIYYDHPDETLTMMDLYEKAKDVLSRKGYCGEVHSNIQGVLDTRIGDLARGVVGQLFGSPHSVPDIPHLLKSCTVLELDALVKDRKCAVTLFLLTAIREHLRTLPPADGLRFVILIEECHNVFGRGGNARPSEDAVDPAAHVAAYISRMLAELRALGVGVILSEQFPSQIDPMAMKCTSTKLAFQQVHGEDRQDLATSMLLTESEAEDLARFRPGEAFFFRQGYFAPLRMKTTNLHEQLDLTHFPTNKELLSLIQHEKWYRDALTVRISGDLRQLQIHVDRFAAEKTRIMQQMKTLQQYYASILRKGSPKAHVKRLVGIRTEMRKLCQSLSATRETFLKGPYRLYQYASKAGDQDNSEFQGPARALAAWIEERLEKGVSAVLERMERFISKCTESISKGANNGTIE